MWAIISKTIWQNRIKLTASLIILIMFVWMYAGFFPAFQDKTQQMEELMSAYPESLTKAFGLEGESFFTSFESFLGVEHFSIVWPLILIIFALTFASGALAGEVEEGTIEVILSQPISRSRVYFAKYLAGIIMIALFVVISNLSILPLANYYDLTVNVEGVFVVSWLGFLFISAVFSFTFLLSSIFDSRSYPTFITAGLVIIMYVLNILSSLKESAQDLKYGSCFHYFDYQKALVDSNIDSISLIVFIGSIIIFTFCGWLIFNKKDISI